MPTAQDVIARRASWACDVGHAADWLRALPAASCHCAVTSPPYWALRSYLPGDHPDKPRELGSEKTPGEYVDRLVEVFGELRRVLHPTGSLWLNLGDTYASDKKGRASKPGPALQGRPNVESHQKPWRAAGLKKGDLVGVPWMVAFALRDAGWRLLSENIWAKPNGMPESVRSRPGRAHEQVFQLGVGKRTYYDVVAVRKPAQPSTRADKRCPQRLKRDSQKLREAEAKYGEGVSAARRMAQCGFGSRDEANLRSVWTLNVARSKQKHFAVMPVELAKRCVLAGTSARGVCPHCGTPWNRLVERHRVPLRPGKNTKVNGKGDGDLATAEALGWTTPQVIGNRDPQRHVTVVETVGWAAGCKCEAHEPVPAVVVDPFAGAGTSLVAAVELGRRAVGCDLYDRYADIARERAANVTPTMFGGL